MKDVSKHKVLRPIHLYMFIVKQNFLKYKNSILKIEYMIKNKEEKIKGVKISFRLIADCFKILISLQFGTYVVELQLLNISAGTVLDYLGL